MNRRELMLLLGGAAIASRALGAKENAAPVIGFLSGASPSPHGPFAAAFREGLSEAGYAEGQNVAIEYRWGEGHYDRLPALAADSIGGRVNVIVTQGVPALLAAKSAATTIPIVFNTGDDPVATGIVDRLTRPGGNLTGISLMLNELMPKRLEFLSELVPQAGVMALLVNPNNAGAETQMRAVQAAARAKGIQLEILKAGNEGEIDGVFATLAPLRAGALLVGADAFFNSRRDQLIALAARYAVPANYEGRESVVAGGLSSYGSSVTAAWRQVAVYGGRLLNGAKPADLPVQQPTTFELVINLKTAKALGVTIPPSILARADEVIE